MNGNGRIRGFSKVVARARAGGGGDGHIANSEYQCGSPRVNEGSCLFLWVKDSHTDKSVGLFTLRGLGFTEVIYSEVS